MRHKIVTKEWGEVNKMYYLLNIITLKKTILIKKITRSRDHTAKKYTDKGSRDLVNIPRL